MRTIVKSTALAVIMRRASIVAGLALASTVSINAQAAQMTEALVQNYVSAMKTSANSQNIGQVSRLVADDALISLSRKGKTTSLDKDAYLNLLQDSWRDASNYQYDISVDNIVTTGDKARANVITKESWVKDGQPVSYVTNSRVTLSVSTGNAVLLRAVSQVTIK